MIKVCAKDGLYEEAVRIKTEMELSRSRGDSRIYSALIKVCAKEGRIEEAQQFKEEMQHKGIPLDARIYSALLTVCVKDALYEVPNLVLNPFSVFGVLFIFAISSKNIWK